VATAVERLHPDDLAELAGLVVTAIVERVQPQPDCLAPRRLITTKEVVAARPGISPAWLYRNAADCGAIRKNKSGRSPLWFRLADVDAELEQRRKKPIRETVEAPANPTTQRQRVRPRSTNGMVTANGAPRSFDIRPRRAA
jgi:hypothetical protein